MKTIKQLPELLEKHKHTWQTATGIINLPESGIMPDWNLVIQCEKCGEIKFVKSV